MLIEEVSRSHGQVLWLWCLKDGCSVNKGSVLRLILGSAHFTILGYSSCALEEVDISEMLRLDEYLEIGSLARGGMYK